MLEIIGIIIVSLLLWKIVNRTIKNSRDQEYGSPRVGPRWTFWIKLRTF